MKFHETITEKWNPLIMRVFANSVTYPNSTIFGVTGDIDNLGIYVAKNGRAKAENLVDLFNQIIRNEMVEWVKENQEQLDDYAFVASGEELIILGLSRELTLIDRLFKDLNPRLNARIHENRYINIGETGISFGCAILDDIILRSKINQMIYAAQSMSGEDAYVYYLDIMETIRLKLGKELDKVKFKNLFNANDNAAMYRNLVYAHMLNYKYDTMKFLEELSAKLRSVTLSERFSPIYNQCGLNDCNRELAMEVKELILKVNKEMLK